MKNVIVFIICLIFMYNCKEKANPVICTEMFAMVGTYVDGDTLSDYYTQRISNKEIIINKDHSLPESNWYPVLTDLYVNKFKNKQDKFLFVGLKNGDTLIKEEFNISADDCHINKESGKDTIRIKK